MIVRAAVVLAGILTPPGAFAQDSAPSAVPAVPALGVVADPPAWDVLAAKTVVTIAVVDALNSKTNHKGDLFAIRLVEPVMAGDTILLPAGTMGQGEVVHAAKSGWGGKAGEMIVMARYLDCGSVRIPLGHFHLGGGGQSQLGAAFAVSAVVPLGGFLVSGGEMTIPAGTQGTAQIGAAVSLPAEVAGHCPTQ